ncbi:FKBP-type peptidyl-prolyl cis-trans isomerase [Massilia endophytica]|uniref:FKBP-type peptidyl-prolyl cis-trans isomerase n=1 Tax=Massilia endophytica TaxID=2899220 RepID=UPI001E46EA5D|nr:FKBP-type peptidyl-prolyl cis-trans isomerase [Massilia endophytica]UGQ45799.1 FKBP-type peptidyl-prolyl cis-trans isomerase [Massilia endophytica]
MKTPALIFALLVGAAAQAQTQTPPQPEAGAQSAQAEPAQPAPVAEPAAPQLIVKDTQVGKGREAVSGDTVRVHYTGWLYKPEAKDGKGKKFDTSLERGVAIEFKLGAGRVIKGWEQGIAGMKVGGKRTLIIPPELAYGARDMGNGLIPANSTLIFDVSLVSAK